jgi:hypothetical protein
MKAVYEFNQKRNQFKLDDELEYSMIKEEIQEFYEAVTTAERIDAFCDVRYVYEGTQMKYNHNMREMDKLLSTVVDEFIAIANRILYEELGTTMPDVMERAYKIVCDANALKGIAKDGNGKVVKDEAYNEAINATEQIAGMLDAILDRS